LDGAIDFLRIVRNGLARPLLDRSNRNQLNSPLQNMIFSFELPDSSI
jgi:hypothetical protein